MLPDQLMRLHSLQPHDLPLDFIILDDELLLQHLDGVQLSRRFFFGKHDLTEITLTEHSEEVEVVQPNLSLTCRWLGLLWTGNL